VLRLDGYRAWEQTTTVAAGATIRVQASLEATVGRLRVASEPAGARVRVDGRDAGVTPLALGAVPAGIRRVEMVREGHRRWDGTVKVLDGKEATVTVSLERLPGGLVVKSTPAGAAVVVDGQERGGTPLGRLELPEGEHGVRVALAGHRPVERQVVLRAGEETVVTVRLERMAGRLSLTSEPPGAEVLLDGEAVGETPLDLAVPPGRHEVQMDRALHAPWSRDVAVEDGGRAALHAELPGRHLAWALAAGAALAAAGAGLAYGVVVTADDERREKEAAYLAATDTARATALGDETVAAWERADAAQLASRILLGAAVGLAGWSTYSFLSSSRSAPAEPAGARMSAGPAATWRW